MKHDIKLCETCQQPFQSEHRYQKRGHGRFCSISCSSKRKHNKEANVTCAYCDKAFYKNESKKQKSKSGLFFCCREHKDAAQRIGGIKKIMPPHYGTGIPDYRKIAFEHHQAYCNRCNYSKYESVLQVHHKDRDRTNNKLENLEVLCPTCHTEEHYLTQTGLYNRLQG